MPLHRQQFRSTSWRIWLIVGILLAAALLRIIFLSDTSLDNDETLTYTRTQGTLDERLEKTGAPGNHVPLFFLFTGILPHETDFELRLGALWFGLLGIALLIRVTAWLYHDERLAICIAIFVSCTPFMVRFARYARPYPMLFFFSLWTSLLFLRLLRGKKGWGLYAAVSLITYLTHMAAAALPLSQFIVLLWAKNPHCILKKWLAVQFTASLPVLIWLLTYNHLGGSKMGWIDPPNIGRPYYTITNILVGYTAIPTWYFLIVLPPITIAFGAGIWWAIRHGSWAERYWVTLTIVPLILVFTISQIKPIYDERYFTPAAPAYFLFTGLGWRRLPKGYWYAALTIVFSGGLSLYQLGNGHYERIDWQDSSAYVQAHFQTGDCILLDAPHRIVFTFYYPDAPAQLSPELVDDLYAGELLADLAPCRRLWLFAEDPPGNRADRWLVQQQVLETTLFYRMRLSLVALQEAGMIEPSHEPNEVN